MSDEQVRVTIYFWAGGSVEICSIAVNNWQLTWWYSSWLREWIFFMSIYFWFLGRYLTQVSNRRIISCLLTKLNLSLNYDICILNTSCHSSFKEDWQLRSTVASSHWGIHNLWHLKARDIDVAVWNLYSHMCMVFIWIKFEVFSFDFFI